MGRDRARTNRKADRSWKTSGPVVGALVASMLLSVVALVTVSGSFQSPASAQEDPPVLDQFQRVPIVTDLANAVDMEFTPDGRLLILNRFGAVVVYDPVTQSTNQAAQFPVYTGVEAGLLGVAVDPDFATNNQVYLYYSATTPSVNRLSRFEMIGNTLDLNSEVVMLDVPVDRIEVHHHEGGNLEFDANGNLYIGTGDNTFHSGYAALNENRSDKSAEKSAANTMDLRGKILRIHPESDGTYTVPAGNLFSSPALGLPEIYVMGARNPFKFSVDSETGWLFWGDVGPDADNAGPKGPEGLDEINLTKQPGNYGWPHFIGDNRPYLNTYLDYFFDPALPTNDSRWNTGPRELPPAQGAWLDFIGQAYMAGPVYHYDNTVNNPTKLPQEFDGKFLYWDFNTSQVWIVEFDAQGDIVSHEAWDALDQLGMGYIDMEIGPDNQLYIMEYGTGCCAFDVGNGVVSRYDYLGSGGGQSPVAELSSNVRSGQLPLNIDFSSTGSYDPDGGPITVAWDFDTDGNIDATTADASHTYTTEGVFNAQLRVTDEDGNESVANTTIYAGNTIAELTYESPLEGGIFKWNEFVDLEVSVIDAEDGTTADNSIPCGDVVITPSLGHLDHTHDISPIQNCLGTLQITTDHNFNGEDDLYFRFLSRYTDDDGLDSFRAIEIYPEVMAAEYHDGGSGVQIIANTDARFPGLRAIRATDDGAHFVLNGRNLSGINGVELGVATTLSGTSVELRTGSPTGPVVGSVNVPNTGSFDSWTTVTIPVNDPGGLHDYYFVFNGSPTELNQMSISSIVFDGPGISYRTPPELTTVVVTPPTARVLAGDTQQFTAETLDQYGAPFAATVTWTSGAGGTIDSDGLFSAVTEGTTPTVIATASPTVDGSAQVTVPLEPAIMFVSGTAPGVPSADQPALDRLLAVSSDVTVADDDTVTAGDASGMDLIVVASSVVPSKVENVFTDVDVPLLTWEPYLLPSLGMTGPSSSDRGETGDFKNVNIVDPGHPAAAGLSGSVPVLTKARKMAWGEPSADADVIARLTNGSARPTIFAYEAGDNMVTGIAPAKRLSMFMDYGGAPKWTPDGELLFDAAVAYLLQPSGPVPNQAPDVEAGQAMTLAQGAPFTTSGSFTDDDLPVGGPITTTWSATGPGTASFVDANALATDVTFSELGLYILTLTVNDGALEGTDTVEITVSDSEPPPTDPAVLFISSSAPNVPLADGPPLARVQALTPNVTVVNDDNATAADADGKDLIIITSTAVASKVAGLYTDVAVPIITWETLLYPSLGMTGSGSGDRGETGSFNKLDIVDDAHPLAAGLSGSPQILSSKRKLAWGEPSGDADIVARIPNNAARPTIFAYETGDTMVTGTAPAKRIALFMNYGGARSWTPDGEGLFDAALTYAITPAGPPVNQAPSVEAGADETIEEGQAYNAGGSFTDDALPVGGPITTTWSAVGPGNVVFADASALNTTATFSELGIYTLTLTVNDGALEGTDTVTVTVAEDPPVPTGNLAEGQPVSASSAQASNPAPNAVDGNPGTRWSSLFSDPQWIMVDLGAQYPVERVVLNWETAYGRVFEIQVSADGANWNTVYSETNGNGGEDDISFTPRSGRYVRMYGTERGTQFGYSLWEFEVHGSAGPPPPPPELAEVVVTPVTATITTGDSRTFTAVGKDQYGDDFPTTITWSVSGGGTISSGGVFDSDGTEGTFTVTATSGAFSDTATITVNPVSNVILGLDDWDRIQIDGAPPRRAPLVGSADIDGDGDPDMVAGGFWYENPGSTTGAWLRRAVGGGFGSLALIVDVDEDGDPDLVGTTGTYTGLDLVWAENDGSGGFTVHNNISDGTSTHPEAFPADAALADFGYSTNRQIALTWNGGENGSSAVQLVEIPDSNQDTTTWPIHTVHPNSLGEGLTAGDIDNDGDIDLFQGTKWLRNDGGTWAQFTIASFPGEEVDRNRMADFDGDGDLDAVIGFLANHTPLVWLEQPADPTADWIEHTIDGDTGGGLSLELADMDNDGDIDIVFGEHRWPKTLTVFENVDNATSFTPHVAWFGGPIDHHDGSLLVDVDADGDLDVFSLGWKKLRIYLYENKAID